MKITVTGSLGNISKPLTTALVQKGHTVEMFACLHSGELSKDYKRNKPVALGKENLADFAKDFAIVFTKN